MEECLNACCNRSSLTPLNAFYLAGIQAFSAICWPGLANRMPAGACLRNPQACLQACLKHACRPQAWLQPCLQACLQACLQTAGMPARCRHAAGMPHARGALAPSLGGGLRKTLCERSKRLSKRFR